MHCKVCGEVDERYDENSLVDHEDTPKHMCNLILYNYKMNKKHFSKNRDGVIILCSADYESQIATGITVKNSNHHKIWIYVKPKEKVKFTFKIRNDSNKEDLLVVGIQLAHPQPQFVMTNHRYIFGEDPNILPKKSSIIEEISVNFMATDIGQFEMPIMFTFYRRSDNKNIIFIREMVVMVQDEFVVQSKQKSPFTNECWKKNDAFVMSNSNIPYSVAYKVPPLLKMLFPRGLEDSALDGLRVSKEIRDQLRLLLNSAREIFEEGVTENNYMMFFHYLLWWEEIIARISLRKFNMRGVKLERRENNIFALTVPGLAEKRPSLLRGDRVYIRSSCGVVYETIIKDIEDCRILLAHMDHSFPSQHRPETQYDVRFLMSRVVYERVHAAVSALFSSKQVCRVFPVRASAPRPRATLTRFFNPLIARNAEQRAAVEHIVSGTSGLAPYIVFGPPGTGKTMTIVEAILQLVYSNPYNRIMVCTDSNVAADHIAVVLLKFNKLNRVKKFLLRANSQSRAWSVMPPELARHSNGTSYESFFPVSNEFVSEYRIFVTTLLHAAKYGTDRSQNEHFLQMTHLFIDEAAQASEPAALVPVTSLLAPRGQLVLAGDPQQLGPVCLSREASQRGLGISLLERLKITHEDLYTDENYITMLVKNFRSHPDILSIPNELFYDNRLEPLAARDPLSEVSVLGEGTGARAVVFHAVQSREMREGTTPSYFNEIELMMLKRYVKALINDHKVFPVDIGVIAPYIRQVYKMKAWLASENLTDIEVGTVEALQGKEKRVILVSTVRANCRLLDYDAKYGLGFLVDDKRYNVTLTRAKAKLIIIGNPTCLARDVKWRKYMEFCKEMNSYLGEDSQQMERSEQLLEEIVKFRFNSCRLLDALKPKTEDENVNQ